MEPQVSVLIASDRVDTLLPECLRSLEAQSTGPAFEIVVASAEKPRTDGLRTPVRWVEVDSRNPAHRRNRAAQEARGSILAFLDDDATAEPGWLASGAAAAGSAEIVGGPDLPPRAAPYAERLSNLLLATPWIGSGVPAHEWNPRGGPVRSPHDVALCNLFVRRETFERLRGFEESLGYVGEDTEFVRRALVAGVRVVLDPAVLVRHRRRGFPGPYVAQRWRYRVKTGRLLVERPGLHSRGRVAAFLAAGFAGSAGVALFGPRFFLPALALYALSTWALSFPIWRKDPALFPAVPFAFAVHHSTYFAGLLTGIARGVWGVAGR
ncbi:MAG TPA: glycosyltransferase [Thermoanaerobaculia bacterium]